MDVTWLCRPHVTFLYFPSYILNFPSSSSFFFHHLLPPSHSKLFLYNLLPSCSTFFYYFNPILCLHLLKIIFLLLFLLTMGSACGQSFTKRKGAEVKPNLGDDLPESGANHQEYHIIIIIFASSSHHHHHHLKPFHPRLDGSC